MTTVEGHVLLLSCCEHLQPPALVSWHVQRQVKPCNGCLFACRIVYFPRRTAAFIFFSWLRGLARLCTYISSILSVVSGALSFTVRVATAQPHVLLPVNGWFECGACALCASVTGASRLSLRHSHRCVAAQASCRTSSTWGEVYRVDAQRTRT
jgi:hypothetical protein